MLKKIFRLFLAIAILAGLTPSSRAQQDKNFSGASYYVTLAAAVPWSQLDANYIFTPQSPNVGLCLFVENENTTSAHAITISAFQTGNPSLSHYSANPGLWAASTINGSISSVPANSVKSEYINVIGAANVALVVTGAALASGSPDVANIFAVQTTVQNCGSSPPAAFVQGDQINGGSVIGINPLLICGANGATCRQIAVDGSGGLLLSESATPGDDTISNQFVLGMANTSVSSGLMTSPQVWGSDGRAVQLHPVDTFKSVATGAVGNTALWTPSASKRFGLSCISVEVTGNATLAVAGEEVITLEDSATPIPGFQWNVFVPATALNTSGELYASGTTCFTNGFLSATANNVLSVNLSTALTAGHVVVRAWGAER